MKQVLVVEDHAIVRAGIRRLLGERGDIEVSEAATGEAALVDIAVRTFALVFLDLNLPGLAGMRERIEALGGRFVVHQSGGGVRVTGLLPLAQERIVA